MEEATDTYIDEAKVTFGHDTQATRKSGSPVGARRRYGMRKAGQAVKAAKGAVDTAKKKAAGVAAGAAIAGSIAKDEARRAGRKAAHSVSKAADAVKSAPGKAKEKAKSGIKGLIGRAAKKVASKAASVAKRMSEEVEALKASGKFSEKEIEAFMGAEMIDEDSRRMSNKQHTKRVRSNIKSFGSDYTPPSNYDPDANRGQGEVLTRKQIEKKRRKALRQEEVEAVGEGLTGERYKAALKKGKQYSRRVSEDTAKRATRGGRGGESDFGAGDRGTGNRAARRAGTYED